MRLSKGLNVRGCEYENHIKKALSFMVGPKLFPREVLPNYLVINKSMTTLEKKHN